MFMAQSKPRSLVRVQSFLNKTNNQINLPTSIAFVCLQFTQKGNARNIMHQSGNDKMGKILPVKTKQRASSGSGAEITQSSKGQTPKKF